ncbi:MAG: double-strand break repair protein AddB [Pseudomonadota bacterium]
MLFASGHAEIFNMPAGADFLRELARGLIKALNPADDPKRLSDTLIYVPNARSQRALARALLEESHLSALMMPDIRALGGLEDDDPPSSSETALADLPPAVQSAERIGGLASLVLAYYKAQDLNLPDVSALAAARELASLLDQAALSSDQDRGVDWSKLDDLVSETQLAHHWERSLQFLKIITDDWPAKLNEIQAMDPYARRFAAAQAMSQSWAQSAPETPVIIAGSTGATPASKLLMQAALKLPKGLIIFPGLDSDLPDSALKTLKNEPSHPQYAMVGALKYIGRTPKTIPDWPGLKTTDNLRARQKLIHETLAPADQTADWTERLATLAENGDSATFVREALDGLDLIEAADDMDEAATAALLLRRALEDDTATAALVTPDAGLARQVSAQLKRWGVGVEPSAGLPLIQSDLGSLAALTIDWMSEPDHPVKLMSVLKHSLSKFDPATVYFIDKFILRGPRGWTDWKGLRVHVRDYFERDTHPLSHEQDDRVNTILNSLEEFTLYTDNLHTSQNILSNLTACLETLTQTPGPWAGESGRALAALVENIQKLTAPLGELSLSAHRDIFIQEARQARISNGLRHPRLAIYGPLEARLQAADHMILAGLNEGIWPAQTPPDMFLPRRFRRELEIADPDTRIGLSAHDYAQLACSPRVTLLSAKRREDAPAVASRWLWRLKTLVSGALQGDANSALAPAADNDPRDWLKAMERAPHPLNLKTRPEPRPPFEARPKRFSVSRIETLIRDPYAVYCRYILGLYPLDRLNLPPDARVRGSAIHKALEDFEREGEAETVERLVELLELALRSSGEIEADIIALREKRYETATAYLKWRSQITQSLASAVITEETGVFDFDIDGEAYRLEGTADRIERRSDGTIAILDFKTGKPPTEPQVRAGLAPQMPLQGLIAREGGYKGIEGRDVDALTYIRFGTQFNVREIGEESGRGQSKLEAMTVADVISEAEKGLYSLLKAFADPTEPYRSQPKAERMSYASDYSRLARRDEWEGTS